MTQEFLFDDEHAFLEKAKELAHDRKPGQRIEAYTPIPVHGIEEILREPPTFVRVFSWVGGLTGTFTAFAMIVYSVMHWPIMKAGFSEGIIVSGKQPVAILPFIVIAFELTILFGSIISFIGFLLLSRLPNVYRILDPIDYGNQFVLVVHTAEEHVPVKSKAEASPESA